MHWHTILHSSEDREKFYCWYYQHKNILSQTTNKVSTTSSMMLMRKCHRYKRIAGNCTLAARPLRVYRCVNGRGSIPLSLGARARARPIQQLPLLRKQQLRLGETHRSSRIFLSNDGSRHHCSERQQSGYFTFYLYPQGGLPCELGAQ